MFHAKACSPTYDMNGIEVLGVCSGEMSAHTMVETEGPCPGKRWVRGQKGERRHEVGGESCQCSPASGRGGHSLKTCLMPSVLFTPACPAPPARPSILLYRARPRRQRY